MTASPSRAPTKPTLIAYAHPLSRASSQAAWRTTFPSVAPSRALTPSSRNIYDKNPLSIPFFVVMKKLAYVDLRQKAADLTNFVVMKKLVFPWIARKKRNQGASRHKTKADQRKQQAVRASYYDKASAPAAFFVVKTRTATAPLRQGIAATASFCRNFSQGP